MKREININMVVRSGSPLHSAVVNKRENMVEGKLLIGSKLMTKLLLRHGANVNITNIRGGRTY